MKFLDWFRLPLSKLNLVTSIIVPLVTQVIKKRAKRCPNFLPTCLSF